MDPLDFLDLLPDAVGSEDDSDLHGWVRWTVVIVLVAVGIGAILYSIS
jgi:hypothetical protein